MSHASHLHTAGETPVPTSIKRLLVAHALLSFLVGAQHLLAPRLWTGLAGITIDETVTWRLIGVAVLALGFGSALALTRTAWCEVRILVAIILFWSSFGAVVIAWGILVEGLPPLEWLNVALLAAFAIGFGASWAAMGNR